ncbi:hypothetical protein ACFV2H_32345 [Streptomyces sp. NPDC059629]|uniref:hypothetical protein n=1 Tax=Streptomyces sp. NPDC059629 TaxID=3346889 RepID=UPI0036A3E2E0
MPDYGPPGIGEVFPAARAAFEQLLTDLFDHQGLSHSEAEEFIAARGREVHRLMLQEWFAQHAQREERLPEVAGSDQAVRRAAEAGHKRLLSTRFGTVEVERIAYRAKGASNLHPADAELDLPVGRHSHELKKLAAIEAARGSFEAAATAIERATGTHMGKRQVEQLVQRAAADVDDFYAYARSTHAHAHVSVSAAGDRDRDGDGDGRPSSTGGLAGRARSGQRAARLPPQGAPRRRKRLQVRPCGRACRRAASYGAREVERCDAGSGLPRGGWSHRGGSAAQSRRTS